MNIYVVRHGETDWNVKHLCQGQIEVPLNANGIKQAQTTREKLKDEKIDLIISSPLSRARKTADIINEGRNIQVIEDSRLMERNFGEFEKMSFDLFDYEGCWNYKYNYHYEKAENIRDLFKRVNEFLNEIKEKYEGKNILLATHGGVTIALYCYFNEIPEGTLLGYALKNCEVAEYEI